MKTNKKEMTIEGVAPPIVKNYACEDIDLGLQLHLHMLPKITEQNLEEIMNLDCQLVPVIADMEYHGVLIDQIKVAAYESTVNKKLAELLKEIEKFTKGKIDNINSKSQLSRFLFEQLNLMPIGPKGKNGHYSVSSEVLNKLVPQHEIVRALLDYNALYKVSSTFIPALKKVNAVTGRLHTSFNQTVTATGRLSSSNPNLQNIPNNKAAGLLRDCFVAPLEWVLIGADYSNIELRVMAIFSQDALMLKAYREGIDLHALTASKIFGVTYEEGKEKKLRNVAKTVNFGLIYGMSALGLSQRLSRGEDAYSIEQCEDFIRSYFELYSGVAKCREDLVYSASVKGYTETMFGRKRLLPDINSPIQSKREAAKRLAMNSPIQGTAADILKKAMINIHKRIQQENLPMKMLLQVHDELLFEVPESVADDMKKIVQYEMENAVKLPISLEVEAEIGKTWADVH